MVPVTSVGGVDQEMVEGAQMLETEPNCKVEWAFARQQERNFPPGRGTVTIFQETRGRPDKGDLSDLLSAS